MIGKTINEVRTLKVATGINLQETDSKYIEIDFGKRIFFIGN